MIKRLNSSFYVKWIDKEGVTYNVLLERLHNTPSGCPKFKAIIVDRDYTAVYSFKGHYMSEEQEADWILDYHLGCIKAIKEVSQPLQTK